MRKRPARVQYEPTVCPRVSKRDIKVKQTDGCEGRPHVYCKQMILWDVMTGQVLFLFYGQLQGNHDIQSALILRVYGSVAV